MASAHWKVISNAHSIVKWMKNTNFHIVEFIMDAFIQKNLHLFLIKMLRSCWLQFENAILFNVFLWKTLKLEKGKNVRTHAQSFFGFYNITRSFYLCSANWLIACETISANCPLNVGFDDRTIKMTAPWTLEYPHGGAWLTSTEHFLKMKKKRVILSALRYWHR